LNRCWNFSLGTLLFVFCLPLFAILAATIYFDVGRPVLYRGARLGRNKSSFFLYKFRTLHHNAQSFTSDKVLPLRSGLETRTGKILRETRLDELPQLWNIIRGDMNLFGPRPVRAEIANLYDAQIKDYGARFQVKPGIIGHTQVFMPHGASKRIRAKYNNVLIKRRTHPLKELAFIAYVGTGALRKLTVAAFEKIGITIRTQLRRPRPMQMPATRGVTLELRDSRGVLVASGELTGIDDQELSFRSETIVGEQTYTAILCRYMRNGKRKRGICMARVRKQAHEDATSAAPFSYVASYTTTSDFQKYLMDTYFAQLRFAAF
jgi:lipopolysaccharide/colanic/teichoic acid biosynthesis glycosyltransferase